MSTVQRVAGSFAPPLTEESLANYEAIANKAPQPIQDSLKSLLACVKRWWDLPESQTEGKPHLSGRGTIVALESQIAADLEPLIPWGHELDAIQGLFDKIEESDRELRNAAFHLLWYVRELNLDREPITTDLLGK